MKFHTSSGLRLKDSRSDRKRNGAKSRQFRFTHLPFRPRPRARPRPRSFWAAFKPEDEHEDEDDLKSVSWG